MKIKQTASRFPLEKDEVKLPDVYHDRYIKHSCSVRHQYFHYLYGKKCSLPSLLGNMNDKISLGIADLEKCRYPGRNHRKHHQRGDDVYF